MSIKDRPIGRIATDPTPVGLDWIPRDPAQYIYTEHFETRVSNDSRAATPELAADLVESGEKGRSGSKFVFEETIDGATFVCVCILTEGLIPTIHTLYAHKFPDVDRWLASDEFPSTAIEGELFRYAVHSGGNHPELLSRVDISDPIAFQSHNVTSPGASTEIRCVGCNLRFSGIDEMSEIDCR